MSTIEIRILTAFRKDRSTKRLFERIVRGIENFEVDEDLYQLGHSRSIERELMKSLERYLHETNRIIYTSKHKINCLYAGYGKPGVHAIAPHYLYDGSVEKLLAIKRGKKFASLSYKKLNGEYTSLMGFLEKVEGENFHFRTFQGRRTLKASGIEKMEYFRKDLTIGLFPPVELGELIFGLNDSLEVENLTYYSNGEYRLLFDSDLSQQRI